ncbi:glycosyltransferase family 29 protein [Chelativorans alearense]|uniref:glycosyltransferase family 29 protein n=1 Tax=Chelativorans alearense TaxID=2681495 RepID=UPI0013D025E2|nr:glycosyltransferase family 29 protein [Chelativorans alearense]
MKSLAIVGNGPLGADAAAAIDGCDRVIRFNRPRHTPAEGGEKTDILFFMNSGKGTQAVLADPAYPLEPAVANCRRVILPYHPSIIARYHPKPNMLSRLKGRRADWTERAIEVFGAAGKEVAILPPVFYEECCAELGIAAGERSRIFPSTGFLAIVYATRKFSQDEWRIRLFGFGWEGWKRHDWEREKMWVERQIKSGAVD